MPRTKLILTVLVFSLAACAPSTAEMPDRPAADVLVQPPTASPFPPPRPSAAPPILSAPSSPAASPVALRMASPKPILLLRAGALGLLSDTGLLLGVAEGFYAERGLDVRVSTFESSSVTLAALSSGQLDVASLPVNAELLDALVRGSGIKIVAEAQAAPAGHGAAGLIVRGSIIGGLETPTDLRDMRIGLASQGGALEIELAHLLKQGWLARTDAQTVLMSREHMAGGLEEGTLEAAFIEEPYLSRLEDAGAGVVWRRSDQILPNHLTAVLVFSSKFARQQPEAARRYLTGFLKSLRLYNEVFLRRSKPPTSTQSQILAQSMGIWDPAELERVVLPGMNPNGMVNIQTLRLDQQYLVASGQQLRLVDLAAVVDAQYAAYAITQLGEYR